MSLAKVEWSHLILDDKQVTLNNQDASQVNLSQLLMMVVIVMQK